MAKSKKWISKAIKHPGRETRRAAEHGISVHQQMERDSHSKNPSLRGAGNLGLRLSKMHKGTGEKPKASRAERWYGKKD